MWRVFVVVVVFPLILACSGLLGSTRTDLDAICTAYKEQDPSILPEDRASTLTKRIVALPLMTSTKEAYTALGPVAPGARYEQLHAFANDNGVADWQCSEMERQDDAEAVCGLLTSAVKEQPADPFAAITARLQGMSLAPEVVTFLESLAKLAPGTRTEAVRTFLADRRLTEGCSALAAYDVPATDVARSYLELMTQSKVDEAKAVIASTCLTGPVAKGEPVKLLGAVIQATEIKVEPGKTDGVTAEMLYTVRGSASKKNTKTTILGVSVSIASVTMSDASRSGTLTLVQEAGMWKVGCP